jgi:serine/threonine-protein kinase PpkA
MAANDTTQWRCQNYGGCSKADARDPIPLDLGQPFVCPECAGDAGLQLKEGGPSSRIPVKPVLFGLLGLFVLIMLVKMLIPPPPLPPEENSVVKTAPTGPGTSLPISVKALTDKRTGLARQVLSRPKSLFYKDSNREEKLGTKPQNFERLFVFEDKDGWLKVGYDSKSPLGWMEIADTVDWPHSVVVEYTTPDNRKPVLFFRDQDHISSLLDNDSPTEKATQYYTDIENAVASGSILSSNYPVVSVEPRYKSRDVYVMPVLDSKEVDIDGRPARMLKITAAGLDRGATTLSDYVPKAKSAKVEGTSALAAVDVDLVFVMDMTGSMQPWLDGAVTAIRDLARNISSTPAAASRMKLGFWGYQDDPSITGIQYRTKNYTQSLLAPIDFLTQLENLKVNKLTSDSYPEDVFAGVNDAIHNTKWRAKTKILVVIGDAPGHTSVKDGSASDLNAAQLRQLATDAGVQIVSISIKDSSKPAYLKHHALAEEQFRILASNGNRPSAFETVTADNRSAYTNLLETLTRELALQTPSSNESKPQTPEDEKAKDIVKGLLAAAKVDVVSEIVNDQGAVVLPRDITAWVVDVDMTQPGVRSLEPKLLITKNELSSLQTVTTTILTKAREKVIVGGSFFDAVMGAVASSASGGRTGTLADKFPLFIKGLPYKSPLMEKSRDWWEGQTAEQQQEFVKELEAKLAYYRSVNENPAMWKPLNKDAESGDYVAAIPLSQLL